MKRRKERGLSGDESQVHVTNHVTLVGVYKEGLYLERIMGLPSSPAQHKNITSFLMYCTPDGTLLSFYAANYQHARVTLRQTEAAAIFNTPMSNGYYETQES